MIALERRGSFRMPFDNAVVSAAGFRTHARTVRNEMTAGGLLQVEPGYFDSERPEHSKLTLIRIMPRLVDLVREAGVQIADLICAPRVTTVLRADRASVMLDAVERQDQIVRRYNEWIGRFRLHLPDGWTSARVHLVRLFKGDWGMGGRMYGGFWIDMPRADRASLQIDGEATCELDFKSLHPRMLYASAGLNLDFDPYVIPGFEKVSRETGKKVFNSLLNGKTGKLSAKSECRKAFPTTTAMDAFAKAMIERLQPISHHFGTAAWGWLQKDDSELALTVMDRCMLQDIPVYPIHDGFLVKGDDRDKVQRSMSSVYQERYGFDPLIEAK